MSTHNLCFEQKKEKYCKPQFYYIQVGFKGSELYRHVFVMTFFSHLTVITVLDSTGLGSIVQSIVYLTADLGVTSLNPSLGTTFMEIDDEIITRVIPHLLIQEGQMSVIAIDKDA